MDCKITMVNGESFVIKGHPDSFIEQFTGEDYYVITKDFVFITPLKKEFPTLINTRNILKIEALNENSQQWGWKE